MTAGTTGWRSASRPRSTIGPEKRTTRTRSARTRSAGLREFEGYRVVVPWRPHQQLGSTPPSYAPSSTRPRDASWRILGVSFAQRREDRCAGSPLRFALTTGRGFSLTRAPGRTTVTRHSHSLECLRSFGPPPPDHDRAPRTLTAQGGSDPLAHDDRRGRHLPRC